MPSGNIVTREVVEHYGAVAVVALDVSGRILLIEQYRHPVARRLWELPAGMLDLPGELPLEAAARELAEETDISADRWDLLVDLVVSPGFTDEAVRVYLARELHVLNKADRFEEEEVLVWAWVPLQEAVDMVLSGQIVNSTAVAGILATARVLESSVNPRGEHSPWTDRPRSFDRRRSA